MKPRRPWLHCIGGRVERWATLVPPSFVIIARPARSASRVLPLKKSVISCSTAPHFFPELQSSRVLCLPQLLLNCRPCTQQQPTSLEVSWVGQLRFQSYRMHFDQNSWNLTPTTILPEALTDLQYVTRLNRPHCQSKLFSFALLIKAAAFLRPLTAPWAQQQTLNSSLLTDRRAQIAASGWSSASPHTWLPIDQIKPVNEQTASKILKQIEGRPENWGLLYTYYIAQKWRS